jgi:hypothetical protein
MERRSQKSHSKATGSDQSLTESIRKLAAYNARVELVTEEHLLLFLQSWWSRTYNRPLKDPILLTYTLEELLYEFYDRIERVKADEERVEREGDKIEEDKEQSQLDWAEQEEKKELEKLKADAAKLESKPVEDPAKDAGNIAWMEEQIQQAKLVYGDDFGEDIDKDFGG